jgi:ubiquitin C-terminal hydrolase
MPRGIPNVGSTCWLGTAVQVLAHSPQIARVLLSRTSSTPYLSRSAGTQEGVIAAAFAEVVRGYWRGSGGFPRSPIRALARSLGEKFREGRQHDAGEAVLAVIDSLHSSFEELFESRYENAPSSPYVDETAWEAYNEENKLSIFTEILQSQIEQSIDGGDPVFSHPWAIVTAPGASLEEGVRSELVDDVDLGGKTIRKKPRYLSPCLLVISPTGMPISESIDVCGVRYELSAAACHGGNHWRSVVRDDGGFVLVDDETVENAGPVNGLVASVCMLVRV